MKKKQIVSLAMASIMSITAIGGSVGAARACESIPEDSLCKEGLYEGLTADEIEELKALGFTEDALNGIVTDDTEITDDETLFDEEFDSFYYEEFTDAEKAELEEDGLIDEWNNSIDGQAPSGLYVYNGDLVGNTAKVEELLKDDGSIQPRGKISTAVKAFKKVYKKIPAKYKKAINKVIKVDLIIKLLEHYTGALENALYKACRKAGLSATKAKFITKTVMLFF